MDMLQTGLKRRDGSDLLDVSLPKVFVPKVFVPSLCYLITAQTRGALPCHSQAHVLGFAFLQLVVIGLLYMAYANGSRDKIIFVPRLRPYPMKGASPLVM